MKITPEDFYEEAKYPELHMIEKKMRLNGLPAKGTAAFAMAVATAMTITMCGAGAETIKENTSEAFSEADEVDLMGTVVVSDETAPQITEKKTTEDPSDAPDQTTEFTMPEDYAGGIIYQDPIQFFPIPKIETEHTD
jgi:hypothetical protein